jgi:hypothetical protein
MLATLSGSSLRSVIYQGLRKVIDKFTWTENAPLALKVGETIVAVGKTTKGMSFYIENEMTDGKNCD